MIGAAQSCGISGGPSRPDRDRTELAALERRMLEAEVAGDTAFFRRLELCGYRFVGWRGEQLTRREDVAAVGEPRDGRVQSFEVDQLVVQLHGESALVWGRITMTVLGRDTRVRVSRSRFTHVYLRRERRWRLAAAHSSPLP